MPERQITAPRFWGEFITNRPIVGLTGVTYNVQEHGIPSNNEIIWDHKGTMLERNLLEGSWPYVGSVYLGKKQDIQTFAVGSLFYIHPGKDEDPTFQERKVWAYGETFEKERHFSELVDYQNAEIFPMAVIMLDFDCKNTSKNLIKITEILKNTYPLTPWTIINSGQSFHLVINELVNPKNVPWHWGKIIKSLSEIEDNPQKEILNIVGESLKKDYKNPEALKEIVKYILTKACHVDDNKNNQFPFIVDLRWMAHSLNELIKYVNTKEGSFGFLRISDKDGNGKIPYVIYQHSPTVSP